MPNGGVPIHMVLRPQQGGHVIYCIGAELKVYSTTEWDKAGPQGKPILRLETQEAQAIERFLRYWLSDKGDTPYGGGPGVDVQYDF